ncbi:MAG: hypothetical protein LBG80_07025 [Bacteroidales bacterium]|jgi:hypothetical protein|nr:hypothetical protein [Bacteroidales bacterium]
MKKLFRILANKQILFLGLFVLCINNSVCAQNDDHDCWMRCYESFKNHYKDTKMVYLNGRPAWLLAIDGMRCEECWALYNRGLQEEKERIVETSFNYDDLTPDVKGYYKIVFEINKLETYHIDREIENYLIESIEQDEGKIISLADIGIGNLFNLGVGIDIFDTKKFAQAIKNGKFQYIYKGEEQLGSLLHWRGNQYMSSQEVLKFKNSVIEMARVNKYLNYGSIAASGATIVVSGVQFANGEISGGEFSMDIVFTGIGFIGPIGAVASGIYFISKNFIDYDKVMTKYGQLQFENIKSGRLPILKY